MEAIVILGAAVRADGQPSPALARRIGYGAEAARAFPDAPIFCSGARGAVGPSEASVMAERLLGLGVKEGRLVLDEASRDTLQTVVAACGFIKARGLEVAVVCTERYHIPRSSMLFRRLGVRAMSGPVPYGPAGSAAAWLRMQLRECAAYPYDLGVVVARRRSLRELIAAGHHGHTPNPSS